MNLYVGNLPYDLSEDDLRATFAAYGEVASANIITDRETGRSKGFGFVEMPDNSSADAAIKGLNGSCLLYTSPSPRDRTRSRMPSSA